MARSDTQVQYWTKFDKISGLNIHIQKKQPLYEPTPKPNQSQTN